MAIDRSETCAGAASATARLIRAQLVTDLRNVTHDSLLAFVVLLPLTLALIYRFVLPDAEAMARLVESGLAPSLEPYRGFFERFASGYGPVLMGTFVGLTPGAVGSVFGLLLVDERDARTLAAVRVTPQPFARYMAARMFTPCALSFAATILAYPIAGLAPTPLAHVAVIALAGASVVPAVALFVVTFAPNKVAGLVMMRIVTVVLALPVFAYFVAPGVARLAWPIPSYWQMKALWLAADGAPFWGALLVVPALSLPLTIWLYRAFARRPER
jgi:fluoroquinolone transport system permease protein